MPAVPGTSLLPARPAPVRPAARHHSVIRLAGRGSRGPRLPGWRSSRRPSCCAAPRRSTSRAVPRCPRPSSSAPSTRRRPGPADATSAGVEVHRMLFRRRSRKDRMLAAAGRLLPPRRAAAMAAVISSLAALICCQLERVGAAAEADLMRRRNRRATGHRSSCAGATASSMAACGPACCPARRRSRRAERSSSRAATGVRPFQGAKRDAWTPPRVNPGSAVRRICTHSCCSLRSGWDTRGQTDLRRCPKNRSICNDRRDRRRPGNKGIERTIRGYESHHECNRFVDYRRHPCRGRHCAAGPRPADPGHRPDRRRTSCWPWRRVGLRRQSDQVLMSSARPAIGLIRSSKTLGLC